MTNSVEYSYYPSWKSIFLVLFVPIIALIVIPSTPIYIISALFLLGAFIMVIHVIFLKRKVILTDKNITVPSGLFRMFPKTCDLNDIIEFSEKHHGYGMRAITLTTETNKYEIVSTFMKPDEYYELSDKIENTLLEIKGKPLKSKGASEDIPDRRIIGFLETYYRICAISYRAFWSLFIAAIGQTILFGLLLRAHVPTEKISIILGVVVGMIPALVLYTLTFFQAPLPITPRAFRHCLLFVICWYGINTLVLEALNVRGLIPPAPKNPHAITFARICMHMGWISLVPLVKCSKELISHENLRGHISNGV